MRGKEKKGREKRHLRIRKRIMGTEQKPRLSVNRSLKNIYVQLIDDFHQRTLLAVSTRDKDFRKLMNYGGNVQAATALGKILAEKAKEKGLAKFVFDRGGYLYHGRIKALSESARAGGLVF